MFTSDFVLKNPVNVWINKVRRGVFHYPGIVKCNHSSPIYIIVFSLLDFLFIVLIKKINVSGWCAYIILKNKRTMGPNNRKQFSKII